MLDEREGRVLATAIRVPALLAERTLHGLRRADVLLPAGQYARRRPLLVEATALEPPQAALHAEYMAATQQRYDPLRCLTLADAIVAGQGTVVTSGGALLHESAAEFLAQGLAPEAFRTAGDGRYALDVAVTKRIERPSVLVKRPWYQNFGHWLIDGAALVAMLSRARLPAGVQLVIGHQSSEAMRRVVAEMLALVAPGLPVVAQPDDEAWSFAHLLYVTPVHVPPLAKLPESLACLRALVLRGQLATRLPGRRLFIRRAPDSPRQLDNEAALWAMCAERGFEPVAPETLPMAEQARLFHEADIVVGVKGAALANLLFCRPGTAAVVLSPGDFPDPFFWDISGQLMGRYVELFGPLSSRGRPQSHNPFGIEPARFRSALEAVS